VYGCVSLCMGVCLCVWVSVLDYLFGDVSTYLCVSVFVYEWDFM
jgi:hypothetical protein